jgi:ribulose-5-phosphate 4-epimerase/fuculose-1-phosphate aldolase
VSSEAELRSALVQGGRALLDDALVRGTQGNLSARDGDRVLITPSAVPYRSIEPGDIVVTDMDGAVLSGDLPPSSEHRVHLAIYARRPDVRAIVHTHSRTAVLWSDLGEPLSVNGATVPTAEYAPTGTDDLASNAVAALGDAPALLMAGHGVVALGATLDEARAVAASVEAAAADAWRARALPRVAAARDAAPASAAAIDADALLADARRPLVIGIGGGGDVAGALAVAEVARLYHGADPVVGGVTWERRPVDPEPGPRRADEVVGGELIAPGVVLAGPDTRVFSSGVRFAESHMAAFLGEPTVLIDPHPGPRRLAGSLAAATERLGTDLTIFVDVGGDVLGHGDEPGLASPLCDAVLLAAAVRMQRAGQPVLGAVFGPGCDGELKLDEVFARVAEVAAAGGMAGARGLTPAVATRLEHAVRTVPTEASAQALKAFRGQTGPSSMRGGRRSVELSPVSAMTIFFDPLVAVESAARCAAAVYDARSLEEANDLLHAIGVVRSELDWEREMAAGDGASP